MRSTRIFFSCCSGLRWQRGGYKLPRKIELGQTRLKVSRTIFHLPLLSLLRSLSLSPVYRRASCPSHSFPTHKAFFLISPFPRSGPFRHCPRNLVGSTQDGDWARYRCHSRDHFSLARGWKRDNVLAWPERMARAFAVNSHHVRSPVRLSESALFPLLRHCTLHLPWSIQNKRFDKT